MTLVLAEGALPDDPSVRSFTGTIVGAGNTRSSSKQVNDKIASRMFAISKTQALHAMAPERFAEVWERLRATGLFELPARRAGNEDAEIPYFLVESEKRQWWIERPGLQADAHGTAVRTWDAAKLVFFGFLNER